MFRAAHGVGRVDGDDLAGDQPVEQHPNGGQVLFDRRLFEVAAHGLDVGGDVERFDIDERLNFRTSVAPIEESTAGPKVGHAGVVVRDRRGEEFQKASRRLVAGLGDQARKDRASLVAIR